MGTSGETSAAIKPSVCICPSRNSRAVPGLRLLPVVPPITRRPGATSEMLLRICAALRRLGSPKRISVPVAARSCSSSESSGFSQSMQPDRRIAFAPGSGAPAGVCTVGSVKPSVIHMAHMLSAVVMVTSRPAVRMRSVVTATSTPGASSARVAPRMSSSAPASGGVTLSRTRSGACPPASSSAPAHSPTACVASGCSDNVEAMRTATTRPPRTPVRAGCREPR